MASINISEDDFVSVAHAANIANERGDDVQAKALDKIARKINAALTNSNSSLESLRRAAGMGRGRGPSWQDMPSTIIDSRAALDSAR